jgi:hypothetical protein
MREVCQCSNQTVKLVSRRLRHAASFLSPLKPFRDRLELLVCQVQSQGLQPIDFASAAGEDALVAIAQALPTNARLITPPGLAIDTETISPAETIIVDSLSHEYKTAKIADYRALYSNKPYRPIRGADERTFSEPWRRVLQHARGRPR